MSDGWKCFRLAARGNEGGSEVKQNNNLKKTNKMRKKINGKAEVRDGRQYIYLLDNIYRTHDRKVQKVN